MESTADKVVEGIRARETVRRYAVLERAVDKVPPGLTPEQFEKLLSTIASRLPTPKDAEPEEGKVVEGLINGYHEQALLQARAQFWFSVVIASIGFIWILYTGWQIELDQPSSALKTIPGVIMDAVAVLFFRQAAETRQRATDLYDRLRKDKQLATSIDLVETIGDEKVRSAVQAQIALYLAGLDPVAIDLTAFLGGTAKRNQRDRRKKSPEEPADEA